MDSSTDVALIGAGPIGLEMAVALKRAGVDYLHFDAGQIAQTILGFPPAMRFYSSPERIAIAGVPIQSVDQSKLTREEYLAYLRAVALQFELQVRVYQRVVDVRGERGSFILTTERAGERRNYLAKKLILATGGTTRPRMLNIPGENLPHVSHRLEDPHKYFGTQVLIVGGKNSAVEAALRCSSAAAARVTISYRRGEFPGSVKYWLRPEIEMLIQTGRITAHFETEPVRITNRAVTLRRTSGETFDVEADFVLLMIGWQSDMALFRMIGVELKGHDERPAHDEATMETNIPGVYAIGTATAGTQSRFAVFLENCHSHVDRTLAAITGLPLQHDRAQPSYTLPET